MKLLTQLEEEESPVKESPSCDKLKELLSILSMKEDSLMGFNWGIQTETPTDEFEKEIMSALDYQDHITMCKSRIQPLSY